MVCLSISVIIILTVLILLLVTRNYEKEIIDTIDKKQYKLYQIMPLSFWIMDKVIKDRTKGTMIQKTKEKIILLYGVRESDYRLRIHNAEKISLSILIILAFSCISLIVSFQNINEGVLSSNNTISRPGYNESSEIYNLNVKIEGQEYKEVKNVDINVTRQRLTQEQLDDYFENIIAYIDEKILGKNQSFYKIEYPLVLIKGISGIPIRIEWETSNRSIVDEDGYIYYDNVESEGSELIVTAILTYYDEVREYDYPIKVYPLELDMELLIEKELHAQLLLADANTIEDANIVLPDTLLDEKVKLNWQESKENTAITMLLLGFVLAIIMYFAKEEELKKEIQERNQQMQLDFPEFINKLTLLISAGMTITKAWEKIIKDYNHKKNTNKGEKRFLYEEAVVTWFQIQGGTSEIVAYEEFGKRCKLPEFMKFSSLLLQNLRKGTNTLIEALNDLSTEVWVKRKDVARILGEQASSKLLIPMMMMLLIVLIVILVPAFLSVGI